MKINLAKLFAALAPIAKAAAPIVITAIVTHQSAKAAALDVVRAELAKTGA